MAHSAQKINPVDHSKADPQPSGGQRHMLPFLGQLRERKVCRAAVVYMLAAWLVLQVGEIIVPALGLPDWTLTLVVVLAALGFPLAMALAWLFDWTPDGVVVDASADASQRSMNRGAGRWDCALNIALLLAAVALSVQLAWTHSEASLGRATAPAISTADTLIVESFTRTAGGQADAAFGLEDEIRHHLLRSAAGLNIALHGGDASQGSASAHSATLALHGSVHESEGRTRLVVHLIDLKTRHYIQSVLLEAGSASATSPGGTLAQRTVEALLQGDALAAKLSAADGVALASSGANYAAAIAGEMTVMAYQVAK